MKNILSMVSSMENYITIFFSHRIIHNDNITAKTLETRKKNSSVLLVYTIDEYCIVLFMVSSCAVLLSTVSSFTSALEALLSSDSSQFSTWFF